MNWDRIEGNWKQLKGSMKERWGKLTDDEFDQVAGHRDKLVGRIQERYGYARDEAERHGSREPSRQTARTLREGIRLSSNDGAVMKRNILFLAMVAAALALGACASNTQTSDNKESTKETTGQYVDDATVTAKVKTAIASDVGVKAASNVNVETYRGVVQLSGFADSEDQASKAVTAAKKVSGVRSVKNDIRIKR